jgi:hypothetical protein
MELRSTHQTDIVPIAGVGATPGSSGVLRQADRFPPDMPNASAEPTVSDGKELW